MKNRYKSDYYIFLLLILVISSFYLYQPLVSLFRNLPLPEYLLSGCIFQSVTSVPCPLCGLSRSAYLGIHWNFADSIRYHPLGLPMIAALTCAAIFSAYSFVRGRNKTNTSFNVLLVITASLFIIVWIIRLLFFDLASARI